MNLESTRNGKRRFWLILISTKRSRNYTSSLLPFAIASIVGNVNHCLNPHSHPSQSRPYPLNYSSITDIQALDKYTRPPMATASKTQCRLVNRINMIQSIENTGTQLFGSCWRPPSFRIWIVATILVRHLQGCREAIKSHSDLIRANNGFGGIGSIGCVPVVRLHVGNWHGSRPP